MIKFSHVTKIYKNNTRALNDVTFSIDHGEFVFIVGSSGAGKSTIIKHILREETATNGSIFVNSYNLNKIRRRHIPKYRRSLGVVFQDFRLIPDMNVYDNIAFALRVTNIKNSDIKRRVPYILNLVGLTSKARCFPSQISGGEQQRVALARALVNNPSIIIADEPTGNIDPELSFEIMDLLKEINKCGTTVLVVTHEHDLVKKIKGRVINIENGQIFSDSKDQDWSKYGYE
ncbi:MAG: cell division ATP-binding protein FtsE [Oscillospiraceae bacterium]|nr:cell division ATP-binding protein FtsE [Oscillospiraceae bacterium]